MLFENTNPANPNLLELDDAAPVELNQLILLAVRDRHLRLTYELSLGWPQLMDVFLLHIFNSNAQWLVEVYDFDTDEFRYLPVEMLRDSAISVQEMNIFVISSIWQKSKRIPLKQVVMEGVGETGSVISSAGLILAGTFAVLITMPVQLTVQKGVIVALGILLDTFVVRPFLVPAITLLLGKWAFWPGRRNTASDTETRSGEVRFEVG